MIRHVVVPTLFPPPGYAHASLVEAGERLAFLAGGVPLDAEGQLVGEGDRAAQAARVLANVEEALRAVGSAPEHVVASSVYVVGTTPAELNEAWQVLEDGWLSRSRHTSTLLGVPVLGYTGQLVEVTVTAVVPA